ncbi:unnamed protein product [Prunus brigantina]
MKYENAQQVNGKGKSKQDYNAWSAEESRMLLQLMVDAASCGWCDANDMLSKATVETKILPKINEKLREYQKYSHLIHHNSGFGWDPTTKKFTAPKEVWKDYFKVRPLIGKVPQKAQVRGNELEHIWKGMLSQIRPPNKLWEELALALIQLPLTSGESITYCYMWDAITETPNLDEQFLGMTSLFGMIGFWDCFLFRYHLQEFGGQGHEPANEVKLFNFRHASLRNVIERIFGIFKSRFKIFKSEPPFQYMAQTEICRYDEFPIELENESSSSSSLPVNEGDLEPGFQTQEQQQNANE